MLVVSQASRKDPKRKEIELFVTQVLEEPHSTPPGPCSGNVKASTIRQSPSELVVLTCGMDPRLRVHLSIQTRNDSNFQENLTKEMHKRKALGGGVQCLL